MVGNISIRYVHSLHYLPSYTEWNFKRDLRLVFEVQYIQFNFCNLISIIDVLKRDDFH